MKPNHLIVRGGSEDYNKGGVKAEVLKIVPHKKYSESSHDYDIAVLKLKGCLALTSSNINEIPISEKHFYYKECSLTGWLSNGGSAGLLQVLRIGVHSHTECEKITNETITKRMLCAVTKKNDTCIDFPPGSPLVANGRLVGIKSFGFRCIQNQSDFFTNISVFYKFIQKVIKRFT